LRVYKFLNAKFGTEGVLNRRIKISRFDQLNDPFDCHALIFDTDSARDAWQRTVINIGKDRGLACFSKGIQNPLLWSHYAEDHKGLVLGFDLDESISVLKMNYTSKFLDARGFESFDRQKKLSIVKKAFSRKFIQWKYENEVRAFITLDHSCSEEDLYFLDFDHEFRLVEVILGSRCEADMKFVSDACRGSGIVVRRAWLSSDRYEVVLY
jgi:Protein of unknown function (DUF2971)